MIELIAVVLAGQLIAGVAGYFVCRATHRQKGLEADSFEVTFMPDPTGSWLPKHTNV